MAVRKFPGVADILRRSPDRIDQPLRRAFLARDRQILVADHIEQDHGLDAVELFFLLQPFDHVATAVSMVIAIQAFTPIVTKSLFAVEEDEPVSEFSLP